MVDTCATERKEKLKYQKLGSVFLLGCVVVQLLCQRVVVMVTSCLNILKKRQNLKID